MPGRRSATVSESSVELVEVVQGEVVDPASALEAETRIKEALRDGKDALWRLNEALYDFDQRKGWAALGYENLSGWLNDPEIDMTRGSYYRAVNTWRKLVVQGGVKPAQLEAVSASKAALIADDVVEGRVRPAAALKDVTNLTANQLREKYEKPRRGRPVKDADAPTPTPKPNDALVAARELPWDFMAGVLDRGDVNLRQARLRQAIVAFLGWRDEYL